MWARSFFSTLRGTYLFMVSFGLFMGIVFPFYSAQFFGAGAFTPFYVAGCLVAGVLVGTVCYGIIKQVLRIHLDRQCEALSHIVGVDDELLTSTGTDQLQASMAVQKGLLSKVEGLIGGIKDVVERITPLYLQLTDSSRHLAEGNAEQVQKVRDTLEEAKQMNVSFGQMLKEIEEITRRTEDRTSISTEMSSTTDAIAEMVVQFNDSLGVTTGSIEEIAAGLRDTTDNVEQLAVSTEQTVGSVTEISASIAQVRDNALKTADFSGKVQRETQEGLRSMASLVEVMTEIALASRQSSGVIQRLSQHSGKIGSFLEVIKDIVEQTNLLSLNASIIAAQAGERGRSFAVVAEEVRSLAERASRSTEEISALVADIQNDTAAMERSVNRETQIVGQGVNASRCTDEVLRRIEESAGQASAMVQKIADATVEQATASNMISEEAERNLSRFNHVRLAAQNQDRQTQQIVLALAQMKTLSERINQATQEQARGNRQYLSSVLEDNERAQELKSRADAQLQLGVQVFDFLERAAELIGANAEQARCMNDDVETVTGLSDVLRRELTAFRQVGTA